jgi:hypothetical protein
VVISNLKIGTSYFFTLLKEFAKENIRYQFLLYRQEQDRMAPLIESDEVFEQKMEQGYADAMEGRVRPLEDVFSVKTTF